LRQPKKPNSSDKRGETTEPRKEQKKLDPERGGQQAEQTRAAVMGKDNANPTILNVSQLPTRQAKKKKVALSGPGTKYASLIFSRPAYLSSSASSSDDESTFDEWSGAEQGFTDDGFVEEPIDEQEIYGKIILHLGLLPCP